jgi:hypothetical protein
MDRELIGVYLEAGNKQIFACAVDWPGWCRSGRDEKLALQALFAYGPRYEQVLHNAKIEFQSPADLSRLTVIERVTGNATTDFGTPAIVLDVDKGPVGPTELWRWRMCLPAYWRAFDDAVEKATGRELRRGPRGGGRDLDKIVEHVLEADRAYLKRAGWQARVEGARNSREGLDRTRQEILRALESSAAGELPEKGPRGGMRWPARYFVRRVAWHVLDHAWEIEDRLV